MITSIRAKVGIIFVGFLLLVAGSVVATFVAVQAQRADAVVINLAGRQRMLTQKITKAALGIAREPSLGYREELDAASRLFDHTLRALLEGGSVLYGDKAVALPPATDKAIRAQLEAVDELWQELQWKLQTVQTAKPGTLAFVEASREIESISPDILWEMDQAVQLYEAAAERKLARLRAIQAVFFVSALALLVLGYLLIQRTVINPITELEMASRRIARGDLETPVELDPAAGGELSTLAQSFRDMRQELAVSRVEMECWADELEARVEQRTREMIALFEVSAEISSQLDIEWILESIVDKARQLAEGEVSALCLLGRSNEGLSATVTSGPADAFAACLPVDASDFDVPRAVEAVSRHEACDCYLLRPRFRRSHLAVPLRAGDQVLGVLCVGHREKDRFGEEDKRLLILLANAGAIALENARLYQRVEQEAALAERERIVAEMHDGLAQTLSFLNFRLGAVEGLIENEEIARVSEQLALIRSTVERTGDEVRRLMKDLVSDAYSSRTLEKQLQRLVERFVEEWEIAVELNVEAEQPFREPSEVYEQVTRVVQEALTNVHKHAASSRAVITLEQHDEEAVVRIQDDGPGFDAERLVDQEGHFGLKVMAARAERIDGTLSVESEPGQGARITLRWPVMQEGGRRWRR